MPTFVIRRDDGKFLSLGKRGGFRWVSSKPSATRFPVGPTVGRREAREAEDKLVYEGVTFAFEEMKECAGRGRGTGNDTGTISTSSPGPSGPVSAVAIPGSFTSQGATNGE